VFLEHPIPISIQADDRQAHPNTPKRERERERESTHTDSKKEGKEGRKKERKNMVDVPLCLSLRAAVLCEIGNDPI
jgi:hypothetical protein